MASKTSASLSLPRARSFRICSLLAFAVLAGAVAPWARGTTTSEYELKAVFLFNFVRFIDWPQDVLPPAREPLVIGILGDDPFRGTLDAVVKGETINGHALVVRRLRRGDDPGRCQVLFISRSETARLGSILGELKGRPVLTVSDIDRFAYNGGMIGLVTEQGRVRLQINLDTANAGRLAVSAKLLRPALVIRNPPQSMILPIWANRFSNFALRFHPRLPPIS